MCSSGTLLRTDTQEIRCSPITVPVFSRPVLPPEVNSLLVFAGAGSGPMLAGAAVWDGLAEELDSAAASFGPATSGLAGRSWRGPASVVRERERSRYAFSTRSPITRWARRVISSSSEMPRLQRISSLC
jgi:hypothetical protein